MFLNNRHYYYQLYYLSSFITLFNKLEAILLAVYDKAKEETKDFS